MAAYRITYADKNKTAPLGAFEGQWADTDANEVKRVVNNLAALMFPDGIPDEPRDAFADLHVTVALTDVDDVIIEHGLGKKPAVQVFDTNGNNVVAAFKHLNDLSARHMFNKPFTGYITYN